MSHILFDRTFPSKVPIFLFPPTYTCHLPESDSLFSARMLFSMAFQNPALIIKDSQTIRFVAHSGFVRPNLRHLMVEYFFASLPLQSFRFFLHNVVIYVA